MQETTYKFTNQLVTISRMLQDEDTPDTCEVDSNCTDYPFYICKQGFCEHKPVFPVLPMEIAGIIVLLVSMAFCNVAGIGGGGIVISFIMIFFKFPTKRATPISSFTILLSSLARYCFQLKAKHPQKDAVVIDYSTAAMMMPTVLIGSFIGAFFQVTLPAIIINILLTIVMAVIAVFTIFKTMKMIKAENRLIQLEKEEQAEREKND